MAGQTREELTNEADRSGQLAVLRRRIAALEAAETERKRAEQALRESEERFQQVAENAEEWIWEVDALGLYTYASSAVERILGYKAEEVVGKKNFYDLFHPQDREEVTRAAFEVFAQKQPFREFPNRNVHKNGETVWLLTSGVPILNEKGDLLGYRGVDADITERVQAEQALQESEELYRTLFENAPLGLGIADADGNLMAFNDAMLGPGGYSPEDIARISNVANLYYDPHERSKVLEIARRQGFLDQIEVQFKRKDGTPYDVLLSLRPVQIGGQFCWQTMVEDITERKRAEERLEQRAAQLALLNDIGEKIAAVLELDQVLERAAHLVQESFGYHHVGLFTLDRQRGELVMRAKAGSFAHLFPTEHRLKLQQGMVGWVGHTGETLLANDVNAEPHYTSLYPAVSPTLSELSVPIRWGEEIVGVLDAQSPQRNAFDENDVLVLETLADQIAVAIENARLLAQVREQAEQVQQIVRSVPEGVLLLDTDFRILLVNPAVRQYLDVLTDSQWGETLTHLGGRPTAELLTSPPPGLWHEVTADGQSFEVIAQPLEADPVSRGWVLVIRDVTQEREVQQRVQQQERLAAVGQLAAGIAHDFNNIMAVIVLYAGMSSRIPDLPPKVHERLEIISQQAKRATDLIQQILDFSRRAVLKRLPMDLAPFLREQIKLLERTLPEHIKIDLAYGVGEYTVNADPTRMQQVIMNLAVNARDAMSEGGELRIGLERIRVESRKEAPLPNMSPGEWVRLTVEDTGTGLQLDVLPHIFDPFFTTKAPGKGSGLGLAQVHGIVKQHEGEIDVTTKVGEGTTFILYLPALSVAKPEALPGERLALPHGQGETILVVEDDAVARKALVDSLEMLNYRALEAANGREALAILEQHADPSTGPWSSGPGTEGSGQGIALVLSDLVMPEMGGQALFHALRQKGLAVPMMMLTGHPKEEELENLRAQGLRAWLLKPPSPEQLAEMVARVLGKEIG